MIRSVVIVGAGLGGLATAIRLRASAIDVTLIESRPQVGGLLSGWKQDGFTFGTGPAALPDPDGFRQLWALGGFDMDAELHLLPIDPQWRFIWQDGVQFDLLGDDERMHGEIAKLAPGDNSGWRAFLDHAIEARAVNQARNTVSGIIARMKALPDLGRTQGWRTLDAMLARHIRHERLREAVGFPAVMSGANPYSVSADWALNHRIDHDRGLWFPEGGTGKLTEALADLFQRMGGRIVLSDAVVEIETLGDRTTGVRTASGAQFPADAVISNADAVHSYRDLIRSNRHGERTGAQLARKRHSPSYYLMHFGIRGSWPGIAHRSVLMGARHAGLMKDIFDHGVLSEDMAIILHHPSVTDPSLAPAGHSVFSAAVPVPHLGALPVDWDHVGPVLESRILANLEARLIPDLSERIVTRASTTPRDFADEYHAYRGSAFGVEQNRSNAGYFRLSHRDSTIRNLYFAGATTWPGPGVAPVLASAKAAAELILEDAQK